MFGHQWYQERQEERRKKDHMCWDNVKKKYIYIKYNRVVIFLAVHNSFLVLRMQHYKKKKTFIKRPLLDE